MVLLRGMLEEIEVAAAAVLVASVTSVLPEVAVAATSEPWVALSVPVAVAAVAGLPVDALLSIAVADAAVGVLEAIHLISIVY